MRQPVRPPSADGDPPSPGDWSREQWGDYLQMNDRFFRHAIAKEKDLNRDDQDDVSQTFALTIWKIRARINPNGKLFSFAYAIARHVAATVARSNRRRRIRGLCSPLPNDDVLHQATENPAAVHDRQDAVRRYIRTLPDRDRTIIKMRYYDHRPWAVVAAAVGLSVVSVHRIHRRLLASARGHLSEWVP